MLTEIDALLAIKKNHQYNGNDPLLDEKVPMRRSESVKLRILRDLTHI